MCYIQIKLDYLDSLKKNEMQTLILGAFSITLHTQGY